MYLRETNRVVPRRAHDQFYTVAIIWDIDWSVEWICPEIQRSYKINLVKKKKYFDQRIPTIVKISLAYCWLIKQFTITSLDECLCILLCLRVCAYTYMHAVSTQEVINSFNNYFILRIVYTSIRCLLLLTIVIILVIIYIIWYVIKKFKL